MRNRLLQITRSVIAYLPELKPYTGSVVGCLLMQQMDFWFNQKPDGFYKFLSPSEHPTYRPGDSWTEELAISEAEFRTAIDKICHRWPSKSAYDAATDKFQGKFYCSVYDRRRQLTTYFRNHPLVDACLDELAERNAGHMSPGSPGRPDEGRNRPVDPAFLRQTGPETPVFRVTQDSSVTGSAASSVPVNQQSQVTGAEATAFTATRDHSVPANAGMQVPVSPDPQDEQTSESHFQEVGKGTLPNKAEKPLSKTPQQQQQPPEPRSSGSEDLVYSQNLTSTEREALASMLVGCPIAYRQDVLDEVAGYKANGAVRSSVIALTRKLILAATDGTFMLNLGVEIRDRRMAESANTQRLVRASQLQVDPLSEETLRRLPPRVAEKVRSGQRTSES